MIKKLALLMFLGGCVAPIGGSGPGSISVSRSNSALTSEFIALTFQTETGSNVRGLLKYETPVRVSLSPALSAYRPDLEAVLQKIQRSAGIDIAIGNGSAQIHVQQIPADVMDRNFPTAACVVASGVNSWAAFRRGQSQGWASQQSLQKAVIFIPSDAPPYIVRACLNEEIGQALGPVNDLYYVADSIFNDDNVHNRLTGFDLLMLRVLYDDRLQLGMGKAQTTAIAATILSEINPAGNRPGPELRPNPEWKRLIETAMIGGNPRGTRVAAAQQAIQIARGLGDHRLIHSLLVYGRLNLRGAPELAAPAFQEAYTLSLSLLGPDNLRTAQTAMHIAAIALTAQRYEDVIQLTTPALTVARRHQDAVLMAGIQGIRALAFAALGRKTESARARLDSLAQARYAFGEDVERIATAQAQIAGLVPAQQ
ncbi:MAG: DUF2927 domain-containing protein [Rhodobacteraceae bacterium]|nr:DUF2927 domain-containing protein [Paracoccaceae bacterium]